eukprot:6522511-Alexandrium_andersonii.AAC.1
MLPEDGGPCRYGLGSACQVDPALGCAPEMRLPLSVAGRRGHSPRVRWRGLRRVSVGPEAH